ncbi:Rieske-like 2Fe-2S protein [Palleronia aestuarii]|uniref:Rieske-like 2Fe-2S protein n=1 Tax=Palleronia aestuarii TaxID=568105 RepID=A0A2W7NIV8_9RHOB|nr:FAD-dependent oxidoreductase [Palleronia aestuarii]PZX13126.1 Rieske-like 2Fe-2S protein [Palleronia aestuarii]
MAQHDIGAIEDFEIDRPTSAEAGETEIMVIRRGDTVLAMTHACPHYGLPLSGGHLDGDRLICPFHHACFDVSTGHQLEPPGKGDLRRYDVSVMDGRVIVEVPEGADPHPAPAHVRRGADARRVVIAGSGTAANACAFMLRDRGFEGEVEMISPDPALPYDRTLLSKAVLAGGDGPRPLTTVSQDALDARDIVLSEGRLASVDAEAGGITLAGGQTRDFDALLVATGGEAKRLDLPGADLPGVHTLRSRAEAEQIAEAAGGVRRAILVGGGFIGLEVALSLAKRDIEVHVVMREAVPLARIVGERIGRAIMAEHEEKGVVFHPEAGLSSLEGDGTLSGIRLRDGTTIDAELAILAVGVRPATAIEGLPTEENGAISVADDLSVPGLRGVWAAGDIALAPTPWGRVRIEHWRVAQQHGQRAARAILGERVASLGVPFFWTALARQYRYLGHAEGWDDIRFDGAPENGGDFTAYYIKDDRVMALMGAGRDAELAATHARMIREGGPLPA